jgi:hypothetical protein
MADKKLKRCPLCNAGIEMGEGLRQVTEKQLWMLSCKCGLSSKLFRSYDELALWWNTRGGRAPKEKEPAF